MIASLMRLFVSPGVLRWLSRSKIEKLRRDSTRSTVDLDTQQPPPPPPPPLKMSDESAAAVRASDRWSILRSALRSSAHSTPSSPSAASTRTSIHRFAGFTSLPLMQVTDAMKETPTPWHAPSWQSALQTVRINGNQVQPHATIRLA